MMIMMLTYLINRVNMYLVCNICIVICFGLGVVLAVVSACRATVFIHHHKEKGLASESC